MESSRRCCYSVDLNGIAEVWQNHCGTKSQSMGNAVSLKLVTCDQSGQDGNPTSTDKRPHDRAKEFGLPDGECVALVSLLGDPISLGDDRQGYTNGQHRSCAVRFSGARSVAVEVDIETTVHDDADWTYLGEG